MINNRLLCRFKIWFRELIPSVFRNGINFEPQSRYELDKVYQYYKNVIAERDQAQNFWTGIAKIQLKIVDSGFPVSSPIWSYFSNFKPIPERLWMNGQPSDDLKEEKCSEVKEGKGLNDIKCSDEQHKVPVVCEYSVSVARKRHLASYVWAKNLKATNELKFSLHCITLIKLKNFISKYY